MAGGFAAFGFATSLLFDALSSREPIAISLESAMAPFVSIKTDVASRKTAGFSGTFVAKGLKKPFF